jgi:hypothetical protein
LRQRRPLFRQQAPAATAAASATTTATSTCGNDSGNLFDHNTGLVNPGGEIGGAFSAAMQARHTRGGRGVLDLTPEHAAEVQHIIGGGGIGIWSPVLKARTTNARTTRTCNARYRSPRRLRRTTTTTKRATRTTKTCTPELQLSQLLPVCPRVFRIFQFHNFIFLYFFTLHINFKQLLI